MVTSLATHVVLYSVLYSPDVIKHIPDRLRGLTGKTIVM
jgi:hypothetical protein